MLQSVPPYVDTQAVDILDHVDSVSALDIFALRSQPTPTGASVLVFQETPSEAAVLPLRLVRSELS